MSLHGGLRRGQGRRIFAATAVMALGLVMGAAPSFAVSDPQPDKVWVCKVLGHEGAYHLQTANNPIHVAIASTDYADAFADSHPSFVLQPGDYRSAEPTFDDCEAKWAPRPAISVVKTATVDGANTNGKADAGELIAYSFLVRNTGDVTLTGVEVVDPRLVSVVTCAATALARGASTTCTPAAAYLVTDADVVAGLPIVNTATATGTKPAGGTVTDTDTVSTPTQQPQGVTPDPAISVVKTATVAGANANGKADAGELIAYSFLVRNTGDVTLTGVTVVDPRLVSVVTCAATTLARGASTTCTPAAAYTVTDADVVAGLPIVNTATATGTKPAGGTVTDTDTVSTPTQQPALDQVGPVDPVDPVVPTISPRITLKAEVVNDVGGTALVSDFTLTGSSIRVAPEEAVQHSAAMVASAVTTSFSGVTGDAAITNAVVPVGTYSLSESALPSGYTASAWACTGGQLNGSALTVTFGNTVECVITNTYSSVAADPPGVSPVDSTGVPTGHPASPPAVVLGVEKTAPRTTTPAATTPTATTPTATTLAFTGAETAPLSLLALFALVLGVALTVAGRRQGGQRARE